MAKKAAKSKKTKVKKKDNRKYELAGVIIIGLGLFALLSVYTSSAGIVGTYFDRILKGLFGVIAYIMPPFIVLIGILTIMTYHKTINKAKLGLTLLSIILVFQVVHLFYIDHFNSSRLWDFIVDSYNKGVTAHGSGVLFSPLVYFIYKWFGLLGSYLFLITLFIVDILLLTNLSLKQLGTNVYGKINNKISLDSNLMKGTREVKGKGLCGETIELNSKDRKMWILSP